MAHIRLGLIVFAVVLVGYAIYEFSGWARRGADLSLSAKQRRIRIAGFVLLLASIGLWYHGTYLPIPHKPAVASPIEDKTVARQAADYVGYWMFTFLVLLPLVPLALLDARENFLSALAERRHLREEAVGDGSSTPTSGTEASP
jgi:hypothetical protein